MARAERVEMGQAAAHKQVEPPACQQHPTHSGCLACLAVHGTAG